MKSKKRLKLKHVLHYLNEIPNINCGGCGVSALAIYRWLKKNYDVKDIDILFCYDNWIGADDFENNKQVFESGEGSLTSPTHVVLKYKKFIFDSEGIKTDLKSDFPLIHKATKIDLFMKVLNILSEWNDYFERKPKVIKNIEKYLDINLSDVKTWDRQFTKYAHY
jgi:hypothetical protein